MTVIVSVRRAWRKLCVDSRRERAGDPDPFSHQRMEALSPEGDGVVAGAQSLDAVLAAPIRDDSPGLLNQRGAFDLDGDVRKRGTSCIVHRAGDRLCECRMWNKYNRYEQQGECSTNVHGVRAVPNENDEDSIGLRRQDLALLTVRCLPDLTAPAAILDRHGSEDLRLRRSNCPRGVRELFAVGDYSAQNPHEHTSIFIGMNWGELGALPGEITLLTGRCSSKSSFKNSVEPE